MARQVLTIAGQLIGGYFGGSVGAAIGGMAGAWLGGVVDPQVIQGPQMGEGQDNRASEGGYRPIVIGKGAVGVCMIHQGPIIKRTIRDRQSKGGGQMVESTRGYRTMAFALGESAYPDTGVVLLRLWFDNKLVYDVTPTSQIVEESAEFASRFTFYPGNNTQEPDPDLEAMPAEWGGGVGNVPAYRGGCPYIVLPEWDVTDSLGRAPAIKAEVASAGQTTTLGRIVAGRGISGLDLWSTSLDSDDWTNWVPMSSGAIYAHFLASNSTTIIGWTTTAGTISYFDDPAVGWKLAAGSLGTSGVTKTGWADEDYVVIPHANSNGIALSMDGGKAFSNVAVALGSNSAFKVGGYWVAVDTATRIVYRGLTPPALEAVGLLPSGLINQVYAVASRGGIAMLAGIGFVSDPKVASTVNGIDFELEAIGISSETSATCIDAFEIDDEWWWIVGTYSGETAIRQPSGSWVAGPNFGGICNGVTFNGRDVLMIGSTVGEGGNTTGWIKRLSVAMDEWEVVETDTVSTPNSGWGPIIAMNFGGTTSAAEPVPLSEIVSWVHDRVEIESDRYRVSELTDMVEGVVIAGAYTAAALIKTLMPLYMFAAGEFDAGNGFKIQYVKRGKPAALTLGEADIVEGPEDWEREDSFERPRVLHVAYQNPVMDYGAPTIPIKRTSHDVLVVGERSVSVPVVFSDVDEITRRADVMMTVLYTQIAGKIEVVLPWSLLRLAPTDCIGFSIRGRTRRLSLEQWRLSPEGTIACEFLVDRQSAWTSHATGLPAVPSRPPPPSIVGPTVSAVLDIPALVDSLDSLHLILAASGMTPAWYGADHQRQLAGDPDFVTVARFGALATIMGVVDADVSAASPHFTDTTNVVRVTLYGDDELSTYTQSQFLCENGAFALSWIDGGTRRWEVMQYRDAVKVGARSWELTTLARGRLNTGAAEHPVGSLFVLLDAGVRATPMPIAAIGQDVTYRAVSLGQLPDSAAIYSETYSGLSQQEFPVAHVLLALTADQLEITVVPRHRFGTDDNPVRSQNWVGYRVAATDGSNARTYDTTIEATSIDVTGWAGTISVTVTQINRLTGPGPTVTESIAA